MTNRVSVVAGLLVPALLMGAVFAQQHSSQDYTNLQWVTAVKGIKTGSAVTTSTYGDVDYWVIWRDGQYLLRVRKDDPSLSQGESDLLKEAQDNNEGVDVEIGDDNGPVVDGVTIRP